MSFLSKSATEDDVFSRHNINSDNALNVQYKADPLT